MIAAIETLRTRIGLAADDDTRDAEIELAEAQALALCESHCDRRFLLLEELEQIWPVGRSLMVRRYPIEEVLAITDAQGVILETSTYQVINESGIISCRGCGWGAYRVPVKVEYIGGYDPLPADLEYAMLAVFDVLWAETPGWGASAGVPPDAALAKVSVVGVGSLDFERGGSVSSTNNAAKGLGALPATATATLQRYLNHTVMGGG
jgi:hypothetical protein